MVDITHDKLRDLLEKKHSEKEPSVLVKDTTPPLLMTDHGMTIVLSGPDLVPSPK